MLNQDDLLRTSPKSSDCSHRRGQLFCERECNSINSVLRMQPVSMFLDCFDGNENTPCHNPALRYANDCLSAARADAR